ncbi:MAG: hypothetical protein DRJ03_13190 [Chloroflexi bacterium]|nr:MAG: hypothetical protein DRJ03_13190 [Chloroflexota bacterium]
MDAALKRDSIKWAIALVIILLAAFAARVFWLDRHPLWWDEGLNVYFAHQTPAALLEETRITHDANPLVYRLAMGGWKELIGSSAFTLRLFSVFLGTSAVALTWAIGCWLTSRKTALIATLFVALSPMQVHYSRETKGYAFALACALLSTYAWGRKLGYLDLGLPDLGGLVARLGWWTVYVLSTTAALGAHYYLGLLVLWQGLWVLGCAGLALARKSAPRREILTRLGLWLLAMGVVALLLTPWLLAVLDTTVEMVTGVSVGDSLPVWGYLGQVGRVFGAGPGETEPLASIAGGGMAALSAIGLFGVRQGGKAEDRRHLAGTWRPGWSRPFFLLSWVAVPLSAAYWVQTAYSFFSPRFLLYLGPACYLLVAEGVGQIGAGYMVSALSRRLSAAASIALAVAIAGLWSLCLARVYIQPYIAPGVGRLDEAEEPRPAIARIRAAALPGDALLYGYIWQAGYLYAYYPQNELALYRTYYTPQTVGQELESIFAAHQRLWMLDYRIAAEDPHNLPASWLEAEAYKVESDWYNRHHLALYLAPDFQTPGVGSEEGVASFDGRIELRYPLVSVRLAPGDTLALPLRWRALDALNENEDYAVFVHLGLPGAQPLAQSDGPPQNGLAPTGAWAAGQQVLDRRALLLPDAIPPGRYALTVGLYSSDGSRLPVGDGDSLLLGYVEVER